MSVHHREKERALLFLLQIHNPRFVEESRRVGEKFLVSLVTAANAILLAEEPINDNYALSLSFGLFMHGAAFS